MPADTSNNMAFIAVGSNILPEQNIFQAAQLLSERVRLLATSTFYQTEPLERPDQPPFINGVWLIESELSPWEIKETLLMDIESRLGRVRTLDKHAPRTIDLDLILYDDVRCHTSALRLPHPDLARPFVHQPIRQILATHTHLPHQAYWQTILAEFKTTTSCGLPREALTQRLQQRLSPS
jgi:2-amino-4-hydroxy-6-hydroxymethyldihydropteridine diphosphokinase